MKDEGVMAVFCRGAEKKKNEDDFEYLDAFDKEKINFIPSKIGAIRTKILQ